MSLIVGSDADAYVAVQVRGKTCSLGLGGLIGGVLLWLTK
jgi:hypothetical protein